MFEQAFRNIDDVLRKESGCTTELDYTEQTSWLLFLKYLDGLEQDRADTAALSGKKYTWLLSTPFRWETWAAPKKADGSLDHNKALSGPDLIDFVNTKLFPHLHGFKAKAASPRTLEYKIGEIFGEIKNKITSGYNLREIIDQIDALRFRSQTEKHELSHLYEAKIKNMGNAGRNGGEYYTPRPLIRAMIAVTAPKIGETIYDGACGSAGFLCEAHDYLKASKKLTTRDLDTLQTATFFGKEKKSLAYVIGVMNLILHGIEAPDIVHTNTLAENLADIQDRDRHDIVLANPPFGGKERAEVQQNFPIRTSETAFLFLQHFIKILKRRRPRRHRHQEHLPLQHRQRLRRPPQTPPRDLQPPHRPRLPRRHLPGRGRQNDRPLLRERHEDAKNLVCQLDPGRNLGKTNPLNDADLADFIALQKTFADSPKSWSVDASAIDADTADLSVKNPNGGETVAHRSPQAIIEEITSLDTETSEVLASIKALL
ncbi:MAG: N-6 DNA methylase [Nibricoccus sp.]